MLLVTTTKNDGGSRGVKCEREPPNSFTVKTKLLHIWERGHNKRIDSRATKIRTTRFEHLNPGKEFIFARPPAEARTLVQSRRERLLSIS
jgi:hypothetical protein